MLSVRTGTILKSVIEQYIAGGVPVPSQRVLRYSHLAVSPATIRNEMACLESEGYLYRPHLSAGAVPSDKGYRYYVESLSGFELPLDEQHLIAHLFHQVETDTEEWLRLAASITARIAQNVSLVTKPKTAGSRLKHLELVALQESLALVILVLRGIRIRQRLITFDQAVTQTQLTAIANRLSRAYSGLTSSEVQAKDINPSPAERQVIDCVLNMMSAEDKQRYDEPYLDGLQFIVRQPEFAYASRLQALMEVVEHGKLLAVIRPPRLDTQKVAVIIGKENNVEAIQDCSVVICQYGLGNEATGTLGVVGPTRMPYGRVMAAVSYMSSLMSRVVAELYN